MFYLKKTPGRTCEIDNEKFLYFSGYSYLGMNHVKDFTNLVKEGVNKFGVLFPSSRISNSRLKLYEEFEKNLSGLTGMEETVSFSSGYLAGKTIADILSSRKNIFIAPGTHPAITLETAKKPHAQNFNDWKNEIVKTINSSNENEFVLIADSINILKSETHDFAFVKKIFPHKKIIFLIDDSHGIGILGKNGEGIISKLSVKQNIEYLICYSLSKAFNIEGGAVSCSKKWAAVLRANTNYTASTAINPSLMYAFNNSNKLYSIQREKLYCNIFYLKKHLPAFAFNHDLELPVLICRDENAEERCYKKKIIISSFGYPDPTSKKINRVIINALHTKNDLQKLIKAFS